MDVVRYRVIVSLDEVGALKPYGHMRDNGACRVRQGDGLTGDRPSGLDPFNVHDRVLDLPVLDQVPLCEKGVAAIRDVLGHHFDNLIFRDISPCELNCTLDTSANFDFHSLISKGGR